MKKRNILKLTVILLAITMSACAFSDSKETTAEVQPTEEIIPTQTAVTGVGKAEISEVMSKNKATVMADDGTFPDWIEIHNLTAEELNIDNWQITDSEDGGMTLLGTIEPYGYSAFFSSGFSVSEGETVYLKDPNGDLVDCLEIIEDKADRSVTKDGLCQYPTPGRENTKEAYNAIQSEKSLQGPIIINEVTVDNLEEMNVLSALDTTDWIEIKNVSDQDVNLSNYYISDDINNLQQYRLPNITLSPQSFFVMLADKDASEYTGEFYMAPFSLNSESDRLYLSESSGNIIDYMPLKNIPLYGSCGRMKDENGLFYFKEQTPNAENTDGKRTITDTPVSLTQEGIYNDVSSVTVELEGEGKIYYTLDGTVPTEESIEYVKPIELKETTIVRATAYADNQMESRVLTQSYIINENHKLPVVSVVSDDKPWFYHFFSNGYKGYETPGVLSYFGEDGSFNIGAGIKMHGDTSLLLWKKNMSFRFRGCYGSEELDFDLFGGGVTSFTNLLLRAGQDQLNTIVRGEAITNLLAEYSDSVIYQRSKYCIVYVDGEYNGIYSIKDKLNEQYYADLRGVSKDSVTMNEATVYNDELFYTEVLGPVYEGDMSSDYQFSEATKNLDLQSLIDWSLLEGWTGNYDLAEGNLRYVKSTEDDGKWRLCLYDLDCAFANTIYVVDFAVGYVNQVGRLNMALLKNAGYRQMFLERAGEVYGKTLTDDKIIEQLDLMADIVRPEVERDKSVSTLGTDDFEKHLTNLKESIRTENWTNVVIEKLCHTLNVTEEERKIYFSDVG